MNLTASLALSFLLAASFGARVFGADHPHAGGDSPSQFKVGEFAFKRPAAWQITPPASAMRAAQLKITDAKKNQSAEVVFFHFGPGDGGDKQANVDRWLGQFKEPKDKINSKVEDVTVSGRKVTYVQAEGTYSAGMMGHPTAAIPNAMLLGAIIESKDGNVFIKLTGPAALVKASKDEFTKMTESAVKEQK
ncbi:MAG: hypothetical protein HZA90_17045 [Verrucomicrobia bacterium]|nr:hypothetical protein [Verrucomicrobiota bacterium]